MINQPPPSVQLRPTRVRGLTAAKTSASVSNLHQLHTGICGRAPQNNTRFPINYKANDFGASSKPKNAIAALWFETVGRVIHPDLHEKSCAARLQWMRQTKYSNGYKGTVSLGGQPSNSKAR